jgi:GT2 family glycosyltransferase
MKVSIIMSFCDRIGSVRNTLTSWSQITYPDYEFYLIDNASKNEVGVFNLIAEFSKKLQNFNTWRENKPTGVNRIWNSVAKQSTGEYVVFAMADEILSDSDILQKMIEYGDERCTINTLFLDEGMTNQLPTLNWKNDPHLIESLSGFWDYHYKGSTNRDHVNSDILSHIIGWTREKWEWFGWFRNNERGHLWLDQDIVIRSNVLGFRSKTVKDVVCYHQWHPDATDMTWLAAGYHPKNERQARLLEESERDAS